MSYNNANSYHAGAVAVSGMAGCAARVLARQQGSGVAGVLLQRPRPPRPRQEEAAVVTGVKVVTGLAVVVAVVVAEAVVVAVVVVVVGVQLSHAE